MESPIAAWDVFCTVLLWHIWCARCKIVFKTDPYTVIQTCILAWSDTIHTGMARLRHLKSTYLLCNDKGKVSAWQDFEKLGVEVMSFALVVSLLPYGDLLRLSLLVLCFTR
jgi:hypothetical protein